MQRRLSEAVEYISPFSNSPKIGIICGSGLGELANLVEDAREVNYSNIPNFPRSTGNEYTRICAIALHV